MHRFCVRNSIDGRNLCVLHSVERQCVCTLYYIEALILYNVE